MVPPWFCQRRDNASNEIRCDKSNRLFAQHPNSYNMTYI
eukprot:SAG22_NODE_4_length_44774_cov_362.122149_3_plen_39_part_00